MVKKGTGSKETSKEVKRKRISILLSAYYIVKNKEKFI